MFAALLCLACHSEKTCTIRGTVTVPDAAQDYYAVLYQGGSSIDTCLIADGKFTLHAVQTSQQQLRVEIHDAQGKRLNDGSLFDNVIEVIPDTDAIDVNVDTYESNVIKLYAKYAGKGLKVVGVTVKDKPEASLAAIRELGINYDQIFDLEGIVCGKYPIEGIPHFFLLDPSGEIVLSGHHNLDEFDAYFQKAL